MKIGYLLCRYYPLFYYPVVLWAYCGNHQPALCKIVVRPVHALLAPFVSFDLQSAIFASWFLPAFSWSMCVEFCTSIKSNGWSSFHTFKTSRHVHARLCVLGKESKGLGGTVFSIHLPNRRGHLPLLCKCPGPPPGRVWIGTASERWLLPRLYHDNIWISNWGE